MNRREWLKRFGGTSAFFLTTPHLFACRTNISGADVARRVPPGITSKIAFIKTSNRAEGVKRAIGLLNFKDEFREKEVFIKPNYNSSDAAPGSTHNDVLRTVIGELRDLKTGAVTIGDRSGMGDTRAVLETLDVFKIADDAKARTVVFDELKEEDWEAFKYKNSYWEKGFAIPKAVLKSDRVVNLCCLKTHQYGGHFTLSLKNSVGLAAKRVPGNAYNFMSELHSSPNQRRMIAEINAAYAPALVVMDGVEAFTDGGPHRGTKVDSEVIIAGTDRVAIDAIGVAILRHFGTTEAVSKGKVFEQEQIAQAVNLGIGVGSPDQIEFLTDSKESEEYVAKIKRLLV